MIFNVNHETLAAADHHDIIDVMIPRSTPSAILPV